MTNNDKIRTIKLGRIDLSNYLIHFTREVKRDQKLEKSSFSVLKEIIKSGYLKFSNAERGGQNTIEGEFPAVCFTEMPLYAFFDYVNKRRQIVDVAKSNYYNGFPIDFHAIALPREKLFSLGARNVIYGLTNSQDISIIPKEEKYRFMLTDFGNTKDWTHEREWRLSNQIKNLKFDGFPVWINNEIIDSKYNDYDKIFSYDPIFVIVKTVDESNELIKLFQKMYSDKKRYNYNNIRNTHIINYEEIKREYLDNCLFINFDNINKNNCINSLEELMVNQ